MSALERVHSSGCFSGFYGSWGKEFWGGIEVRTLEERWSETFNIKHSISVNSATSGLIAAMAAIGLSPGDEVIIPPYTMSATAMAPMIYGGIPVFADIEADTFCIDPQKVLEAISSKTKAVIAVNLFGHPAKLHEIRNICKHNEIFLIEDNAQAPLASENGKFTGTIGDIGVFSLNCHKHIQTGEGGICVTNNSELALRLQAVRNHGENIVEDTDIDPVNMIGFNLRMTELSAALGIAQLNKIEREVEKRANLANFLTKEISGLEGLTPPHTRKKCRHVSYTWALRVDEKILGVSRETFGQALSNEGFPHFLGYVRPLYLLPAFQKRLAIGDQGWPFTLTNRRYEKGLCPVAERMYEKELIGFETCAYQISDSESQMLVESILRAHKNRKKLFSSESSS